MKSLTLRIFFFLALCLATMGINSYVTSGPLLKQNNELALKQFSGSPATAQDIPVGDGWVSYNTVLLGEILTLTVVFSFLFGKPIRRAFTSSAKG